MINKKGLAQIPLMIGLLIMALAIPIATKLVQQNQDSRNFAAYESTCSNISGQYCANSPTSCTNAGNSIGSGSCAGEGFVCCKNAPAPPYATPTPICNGQACVLYCGTNGMKPTCGNNGICVCVVIPTVVPTTPPACIATPGGYCAFNNKSCTDKGYSIVSGYCAGEGFVCCKPVTPPYATPTPICNGEACVLYCGTNGMKPTCGNNGICVCVVIPTVVPTTKIPDPTIPIVPTNPPPGNKCPEVEACPKSTEKDLLQNCTPADADGTSKDYLCNADMVGKRGQCGGKEYCCPSAGGAWTTDMAKCPVAACTQCAGKPDAKGKGDADCSGSTNLNDASIWRSEFITGKLGTVIKNSWNADFDCDGKVTEEDKKIWKSNFINGLSNN